MAIWIGSFEVVISLVGRQWSAIKKPSQADALDKKFPDLLRGSLLDCVDH